MSEAFPYQFVASCSAGMEDLVKDEVNSFGGLEVVAETGVVSWQGTLETAYLACLWSRYSSRILFKLHSFVVKDTDTLYEECLKIDWYSHMSSSSSFAVSCNIGDDSIINHSHYAALRVKDAIVDQFREKEQERPRVEKDRPDLRVNVHINKDQASVYIDLTGESLHKRGYRTSTGVAPLKETLAAAIVTLTGWKSTIPAENMFLDPMCGSATLLIEAALIYGDSAPGLSRTYFGFNNWLGHDEKLWSELIDNAIEREERGLEKKWPQMRGYDADPVMVAVARKNIEKAGLEDKIQVKCSEIGHLKRPSWQGFIVANLPYGERLAEKEEVKHLYRGVGEILKENFHGWKTGMFISQPDLADRFKLSWQKSHKLYNGPISCRLYVADIKKEEQLDFIWSLSSVSDDVEGADFANRLSKNFKKIHKWAKKTKVSCYRIYDRDLPEYNVAIDIYEKWIQVQEYVAPASIESDRAKKRFSLILQHVRSVFNINRDRVFIKQRKRQKGVKQYEKKETTVRYNEIREGECRFLVNFKNYLDTGIFLDHRPIRNTIGQMANGKRFLNLFGYTGTVTVHAAMGGAASTTTVDLSATYLQWAKINLARNGLSLQTNEIIQEDCLSWLKESGRTFDLIFIDPPTFSNTKKKDRVFDIQKDHGELISLAMKLLDEDGLLIFSTNFRKFQLDKKLEDIFLITNISKDTIPFDFQRNTSIHKCFEVRKK